MSKLPQPPKPQQKKPAAARKKAAVKPTAKKQPAKKAAPKKAASKKSATKKSAGSHPWLRKLGGLVFKMTLVVVAILLVIGIYLDTVVRNKMDGQFGIYPLLCMAEY